MKMSGEEIIAAARETVWKALNDPQVLKQCIPGCESIVKHSDTQMEARVTVKVGPVKAGFTGIVNLTDLNPPSSYRISGEGKGIAGLANGGADVSLVEADGGTKLSYDVDAQVGGKLAMLGSRLIDSTARSLATQFFDKFAKLVGGMKEAAPATPKKAAAPKKKAAKKVVKKTVKKAAKKVAKKAARPVKKAAKPVKKAAKKKTKR